MTRDRGDIRNRWFGFGRDVTILLAAMVAVAAGIVWWRWATPIPVCPGSSDASAQGCVAGFTIQGLGVEDTGTIALSQDASQILLVASSGTGTDAPRVLAALRTRDGGEDWRLPAAGLEDSVALSPGGDRVVVWHKESRPRVLAVPDGTVVAEVSPPGPTIWDRPGFDVTFSADGHAVLFGGDIPHRLYPFSGEAPRPDPAASAAQIAECPSPIGQSAFGGRVISRDFRLAVFYRSWDEEDFGPGQVTDNQFLQPHLCGLRFFLVAPPPPGWSEVPAAFASFAPANDRLAIVYSDRDRPGDQTLIEIRDTSAQAEDMPYSHGRTMTVVARFPLRGLVGQGRRIGWSPDGRRLAVISQSENGAAEARIFAIP